MCFEIAVTKGVRSVFLEVRKSNDAAIALYGKLGFKPVGKRSNYYSETGEDALVFMKKLG
jgi:ribosomal-protein-alanine N-acetyltransferase